MKQLTCLGIVVGALLLSACAPATSASTRPDTIQATATTGMVAEVVQTVGGNRVSVVTLMGPGVDPHLFKASAGDMRALESADIIFYNGLRLEAGLSQVLERMAANRPVVAITADIDPAQLLASEDYANAYDPHVWFDVALWANTADTVRAALTDLDPANAELYRTNASAYQAELLALHAELQTRAATLPTNQRVLVTAHDAFRYFGRAYGFEVHGLQGISTQAEASTADVQALAGLIVQKRVPAVFIESSVPQRTVQALQAAAQAQGWPVTLGGELYSDALGDPGTPAGTYSGMVRHNLETILTALSVP